VLAKKRQTMTFVNGGLSQLAIMVNPKLDNESLPVKSVNVSSDRKKVTLQLAGMKSKHVVYIHLNRKTIVSQNGNNLWSTEAWYTMNVLP
jgi:cytochrome c